MSEANFDRVVADPLRLKQRLRIGEDAYALLRLRKTLLSLWDTGGAGWTGVGVAKSTWVASAFFAPAAPTGLLSWFGLAAPAAAVTPIGWLVVAGIVAGGGYYGVTRWLADKPDSFVDTIPKFINTPLDLLGAGLFELMAPLALRVALADGTIDSTERETIISHFVHDWGLDPPYVAAGLSAIEQRPLATRVTELARALAEFQRTNPDCNAEAMQNELMQFLREVIEADGVVTPREERALAAIDAVFTAERTILSRDTSRRLRLAAADVRGSLQQAGAATGSAVLNATKAASASIDAAALAARWAADELTTRTNAVADRLTRANRKD